MKRYNNYHKHDHISSLFAGVDTNTKAEEYIKKSVEYGHTNYFTTNHGSMGDIFEAKTLCDKYGLKCFAGLEGYIVVDPLAKDKSNYHIIIIPRTNIARRKLNIISSRAHMEGFYYRPRIFPEDLLALDKDDVYITTACMFGLLADSDAIEYLFQPLWNHFGDNLFLEVQPHDDEEQKLINKKALELHRELGIKLIAANDSHYVDESGHQERINLINGKRNKDGKKDEKESKENSFILDFPDYDTMLSRFVEQGVLTEIQARQAIDNTLIFDNCEEIDINKEIKMPNIYPSLSPDERYDLLDKIVSERFEKVCAEENLNNEEIAIRKAGIEYEMKTIKDTNDIVHTADYFLFNERNVDLAVNKYGGVLTRGGRGSCGSFYVNKLLGMTQLDRFDIKLPIFPDRFASTARLVENRSLPDIDFNIKEQEPFVAASRELLGDHGCFPMIAYGTMQLGEAFRNVCRSKGMDFSEFNEVGKNIEKYTEHPKWGRLIEEANKYVGTIVSGSVHPCAHILSDKDLIEEYGVVKVGDFYCVMITSGEADEYKVLKNDYLIVKVWKLIDEAFKAIDKPIIPAKQLLNIIKGDKKVWELFSEGLTCTLNQVDSDNGMNQAKSYGISSFEDGAFIAAAIRPSFDSWRPRFLARENYSTGSKDLDKVLDMTGHYILFQENLMQYFEWLGVTPAESIGLIKKISKKKIKQSDFDNLETKLKENWIKNTGSDDMFKESWEMIQSCIAYGFCSAHAAATSLDMCYGAYLKAYYPLQYYTVCFNNYADDLERTSKLKKELSHFGIKLQGVKFGKSKQEYSFDLDNNVIYKGMGSIKGLGKSAAEVLGRFVWNKSGDFVDFLAEISGNLSISNKPNNPIVILTKLDFFECFGEPNYLLKIIDLFTDLHNKKSLNKDKVERLNISIGILEKNCQKITEKTFSGFDSIQLIKDILKEIEVKPMSLSEKVKTQIEYLGYIDMVIPEMESRVIAINNLDTTYSPKFSAYCLKTGQIVNMKSYKKKDPRKKESITGFNEIPFENGDILYMKRCIQKENQKKTDSGWIGTGDMTWWLAEYNKIGEI